MQFPGKHSTTGNSIFTVMSVLAAENNAINLSQGFPDFPIDSQLARFLYDGAIQNYNQYAPMSGLPLLRQAISTDFQIRYAIDADPAHEITITPGATYGIHVALASVLQKGDEVIVLEPAYDSYIPAIEANGAKSICVPLESPDFHVDWSRVRKAITSRTKAIIINSPHNPTGTIWQRSDWEELAAAIRDTRIVIVSDEVYEQVVFDHMEHISVLHHQELRERSFAVFSFGKVFNNTGWKVGYVIAPPSYTDAFRHIHQYIGFSVNTPSQYSIGTYLNMPEKPDVSALLQEKRDWFLSHLAQLPFTIHQKSSGSYFQLVGYNGISELSDTEFAIWLTKEIGVAAIPVSPFYKARKDDKLVRFCFAKSEDTLREAIRRLSILAVITHR